MRFITVHRVVAEGSRLRARRLPGWAIALFVLGGLLAASVILTAMIAVLLVGTVLVVGAAILRHWIGESRRPTLRASARPSVVEAEYRVLNERQRR